MINSSAVEEDFSLSCLLTFLRVATYIFIFMYMHYLWMVVVAFFQLLSISCAEFQLLAWYFICPASVTYVPCTWWSVDITFSHSVLYYISLQVFADLPYLHFASLWWFWLLTVGFPSVAVAQSYHPESFTGVGLHKIGMLNMASWVSISAQCSDLVAACLNVVWEMTESNPTVGSCVYYDSHCAMQLWALAA